MPIRFDASEKGRLVALFGSIVLLHLIAWGLLFVQGAGNATILGLGGLAYSFGLRHAFDADHISAIDNTTRKLLQQGKRPLAVGYFFSLGHSTVVLLIALALGLAVKGVVEGVVGVDGELRAVGGVIGVTVSGVFLLVIGLVNLAVLGDMLSTFRKMRRGELSADELEREVTFGGLFSRMFGVLFRLVTDSWHMYPIGFLFGLGFDTVSEIALLAISAGAAAQGLSMSTVVALPLIFASGMALMDTADGAFMAKAYAWAFASPFRKMYYNLTMTGLSVFVALLVGGVELSQLVIDRLGLGGPVFDQIAELDFGAMGFVIVGAFVATWVVALLVFRLRHVEDRWAGMAERAG